jgi:DedD protein
MFKSRKEGRPDRSESIETIRRQAQYRLVGTAILVTAAVISFSILFDTEPRTLGVDMPIAIPAQEKVTPILPPVGTTEPAKAVAQARVPDNTVAEVKAAPEPAPDIPDEDSAAASAVQAKQLAADKVAAEKVAAEKVAADKVAADKADTQRAEAILNGKPKAAAKLDYPDDGKRRVIQVGAFTENSRARALRLKLEAAGIKTVVNVATVNGERMIRIRVGPYTDARELQTYINRIEGMGLDARVLTY